MLGPKWERDEEMGDRLVFQSQLWLRDESLEDSDNLPDRDIFAQEIVEDLEAALEQFCEIAADLGGETAETDKQD